MATCKCRSSGSAMPLVQSRAVSGLLLPADWDAAGNVVSVMISTFNEKEYLIKGDTMTKRLLPYLGKPVRVYGRLDEAVPLPILSVVAYEFPGHRLTC